MRQELTARPLFLRSREQDDVRVGMHLLRQAAAPARERWDGMHDRLSGLTLLGAGNGCRAWIGDGRDRHRETATRKLVDCTEHSE